MRKKLILVGFAVMIALSGCGNKSNQGDTSSSSQPGSSQSGNHADMNHSTSDEVPKGLNEATNPTFKVGSQAIIKADHMEGMNGAIATIVGAYKTTVYAVSYSPTTGGPRVTNHKWVIHEDIKDSGEKTFDTGSEVVLNAEHMKGMMGATATIDSAENTTVYMVDYIPTTGGEVVKNHKWLTESELSAQ